MPDPNDIAIGGDQWCLLTRIGSAASMTYAEMPGLVGGNVRNNNNIAWKNLTIVDNLPGNMKRGASVRVENQTTATNIYHLGFGLPRGDVPNIFAHGQVSLRLGELLPRWMAAGSQGTEIALAGDELLILGPTARIEGIQLTPEEAVLVTLSFTPGGAITNQELSLNLIQYDGNAPGGPLIGGRRFQFDFPAPGCTNLVLNFARSAGGITLLWDCPAARLQATTSLANPPAATTWEDVSGNSPVTLAVSTQPQPN